MINSTCGFDPYRHLTRRGGCGVWVGYLGPSSDPMRPMILASTPYFHNGIAWCAACVQGFKVRHMGQGVFVRPKEDCERRVEEALWNETGIGPVKGPKLEELYR